MSDVEVVDDLGCHTVFLEKGIESHREIYLTSDGEFINYRASDQFVLDGRAVEGGLTEIRAFRVEEIDHVIKALETLRDISYMERV